MMPVLFVTSGSVNRMDTEAIDFGNSSCIADPSPFPDAGSLFSGSVGAYVGGNVMACEEQCFVYNPQSDSWTEVEPMNETRNYPR